MHHGSLVCCHHDSLVKITYNKIRRLVYIGRHAGLLTATDKVLCGLRSYVNPEVKQEEHPWNSVFKQESLPMAHLCGSLTLDGGSF